MSLGFSILSHFIYRGLKDECIELIKLGYNTQTKENNVSSSFNSNGIILQYIIDNSSQTVVVDESEIELLFKKKKKKYPFNPLFKNNYEKWSTITEGELYLLLKNKRPIKYMDLHHLKRFHLILHKKDNTNLEYYLSSPKINFKLNNTIDFKTFMNELMKVKAVTVNIESLVELNEITKEELESNELLNINENEYFNYLQNEMKDIYDYDTITINKLSNYLNNITTMK
ncbi:hypothetical protein ABK040_002210 [Willaertia magna]